MINILLKIIKILHKKMLKSITLYWFHNDASSSYLQLKKISLVNRNDKNELTKSIFVVVSKQRR